jgi:multiple sugar transport system permease protein
LSGSTEPLETIVGGNRSSPAGGRRRRVVSQVRREDARIARLMVATAVVISVALVLYPLVLGFKSSLEAGGAATGTPTHFVGLRNYGDLLKDPDARSAVLHTLRYVALALVLEMAFGVAIAVVLHRVFRGRGIVLAVLILPWALPSVVSGVLWRRVFDPDSGLLNSALMQLHIIHHPIVWLASNVWALTFITLVHVWGVLPLVTLIFLAGLQSIPEEVYSASAVDGASSLRQFWHITLPLLRPSMAVALTVGTILGIGIFDEIFVLNGTAQNTRSILMQVYDTTFGNADFAHGTALAFLLAGVTALFALVFVLVNRRSTT